MTKDSFSFRQRLHSLHYALHGLKLLWKQEHNARIHFVVGIVVLTLACYFSVSLIEWALLISCIAAVLICELFNSCLEYTLDFISTERNEQIKNIKDLSAAGVLICSIASATIGLIVFVPKLIHLIYSS